MLDSRFRESARWISGFAGWFWPIPKICRMRAKAGRQFVTTLLIALLAGCVTGAATQPSDDQAGAQRELLVFAASSLTDAMTELEQTFEDAHPGVDVLLNFGGSSRLATQILEGAPADLFAVANEAQMEKIVAAGLVADGPYPFATNRLTVIVPADNPAHIERLADLAGPGVRLVLAVPGVPVRDYGDQVIAALATDAELGADFAVGVYANLVSEEDNVRQVAAKVALGEADAGIVYASDVTPDIADRVAQIPIPDAVNPAARYPITRLTNAAAPYLADSFIEWLRGEEGAAILASWGFEPTSDE